MEYPKKCSNIAINNNFVAWKHGHVVATELSRAQLRVLIWIDNFIQYAVHFVMFEKALDGDGIVKSKNQDTNI